MDTQYCVHYKKEEKLMAKAYIKNEVVNMPWEADGFFESKKYGFIAACHDYEASKGNVIVMFANGLAFILLDSDDEPMSYADYFDCAKEACKAGSTPAGYYEDEMIVLGNSASVDSENLAIWGLSPEDGDDILKRLDDLGEYWETYTVDM